MKLCTRCILPETFPGISFDDQGLCDHCQRYKSRNTTVAQQQKYEQKFSDLLAAKRTPSTYDILVVYSGGKDSTYALDVLVNRYRLKVLAQTFDSGFISPKAQENMVHAIKVCLVS